VADWSLTHEALDARYRPTLRTDCKGTYRIEENDGKRPAVARCDECHELLGVPQKVLRGDARPEPEAF
jgi:hypothetical protein